MIFIVLLCNLNLNNIFAKSYTQLMLVKMHCYYFVLFLVYLLYFDGLEIVLFPCILLARINVQYLLVCVNRKSIANSNSLCVFTIVFVSSNFLK